MIFSAPDPALDPHYAAALLRLQHSAYAWEAQLTGDDRIPALQEDEHVLAAWRGRWVTAWAGVDLVGAIAWAVHDDHVDIAKTMVSPTAMRGGVASALLTRVLDASAGRPVMVTTRRDNVPAVSLYTRYGFEPEADEHVPPGVWVTRLRRPTG